MNSAILFHIEKPNSLPIGINFEDIQNIDSYENESIDHILIHDLLDFYTDQHIETLIDLIKNKIKSDGLLTIQSADIKQLGKSIAFDEIDIDLVKQILYPSKKSVHTMYEIEKILKTLNMTIVNKKYINLFEYYIVAKK